MIGGADVTVVRTAESGVATVRETDASRAPRHIDVARHRDD
jgi:hypothetical protein